MAGQLPDHQAHSDRRFESPDQRRRRQDQSSGSQVSVHRDPVKLQEGQTLLPPPPWIYCSNPSINPIPSPQSTLVPITYGCDAKSSDGSSTLLLSGSTTCLRRFRQCELDALTNGQERELQVRDNHKRYPYLVTIESEKAAFRAIFGDWAVRESFGELLWAERPPTATSPVDGYAEAPRMVNTAFRSSFKVRDDARYDAILKLDTDAMLIIPTLEAPSLILDMTRQDVREWLETMITIELKYLHLRATPISRFVDVMSAFLKKYSNFPYDLN